MIVGASAPKITPIAPTHPRNAHSELTARPDWARWHHGQPATSDRACDRGIFHSGIFQNFNIRSGHPL